MSRNLRKLVLSVAILVSLAGAGTAAGAVAANSHTPTSGPTAPSSAAQSVVIPSDYLG